MTQHSGAGEFSEELKYEKRAKGILYMKGTQNATMLIKLQNGIKNIQSNKHIVPHRLTNDLLR